MWEQIQSNRRRSVFLVFLMLGLLLGLGYAIGEAIAPGGGLMGLAVAVGVWTAMAAVAYFQGDSVLLALGGARQVEKRDAPQLYNVVEEMTLAAGLPKPPAVYIIDDPAMNAFATGRSPDRAAVAVTSGLLGRLNRDQLQGVVAHEVAHIVNRDVLLMTMAGVMVGTIAIIGEVFLRSIFYGGQRGRYRSSRRSGGGGGGGQAQAIMFVVALVLAILAPILAQLIYFAVSRRREYLADAQAAVLTRYPEGLASALEAISSNPAPPAKASKATAPMYIINPFGKSMLSSLRQTHPPTDERVRILRSMAGNATFQEYDRAWSAVGGAKASHLPKSALAAAAGGAIRPPTPAPPASKSRQQHEANDLLRHLNQFAFLACACGMRIKTPPGFKPGGITCPRCQRSLTVPVIQEPAADSKLGGLRWKRAAVQTAVPAYDDEPVLSVTKRPGEWQTVQCRCGGAVNLAPTLLAQSVECNRCGRKIRIEHPGRE